MPEEVEERKETILEDSPELDEETAYAIANEQINGSKSAKKKILDAFQSGTPDDRASIAKAAACGSVERVSFEAVAEGSFNALHKSDDTFAIWGPGSVEVVDKENDRIQASALEDALPQLLKRGSLSYEHSDQLVGEIQEKIETDEPKEVTIGDTTVERSEFPTDVLKLDGLPPALYVAGNIYNDTEKAREVREAIEDDEIKSFSISGEAIKSSMSIEDGEPITDISKLDLSAVTLCKEGMNQMAKFGVVKKNAEGSVTREVADAVLKSTMGDSNTEDESPLTKSGMESILDKHLPDGDIATVEDVEKRIDERFEKEEVGSPAEGTADRPSGDGDDGVAQDPEYEGDNPDETASDSDKVEEKSGFTMEELKSTLPDDQFKAIKPALERMEEESEDVEVVDPDDEGPGPMDDPMAEDDEDEMEDSMSAMHASDEVESVGDTDDEDEYEPEEKAKAMGLNWDELDASQRQAVLKADLPDHEVVGGVPGVSKSAGPAYEDQTEDQTADEIVKSAETVMSGSKLFDSDGAPKL